MIKEGLLQPRKTFDVSKIKAQTIRARPSPLELKIKSSMLCHARRRLLSPASGIEACSCLYRVVKSEKSDSDVCAEALSSAAACSVHQLVESLPPG